MPLNTLGIGVPAQSLIGAVVDHAIAVIVVAIAELFERGAWRTSRGAARGIATAQTHPAHAAHAFVDLAVAVVVVSIAHLRGPGIHGVVAIIAVPSTIAEAGAGLTIHFGRAAHHAVTIPVMVFAVRLIDHVFIDVAVAVVVFEVTLLDGAGVNGGVKIVAIAGHDRVAGGGAAVLARWVHGIRAAVAVAVLIDVVGCTGAANQQLELA